MTEKKKYICAITSLLKTCPVFTSFGVVHFSVMKISNIAVVFSDVTECDGSDHCGSIKPFACKELLLCALDRRRHPLCKPL